MKKIDELKNNPDESVDFNALPYEERKRIILAAETRLKKSQDRLELHKKNKNANK